MEVASLSGCGWRRRGPTIPRPGRTGPTREDSGPPQCTECHRHTDDEIPARAEAPRHRDQEPAASEGPAQHPTPTLTTATTQPSPENRADIRDFLARRRAKITPEWVGLPFSGRRRVPGLRRDEVAVLAGVSTEWYTRLEKGHISGVSEDVLDAVAKALQLDQDERTYLFDLARPAR